MCELEAGLQRGRHRLHPAGESVGNRDRLLALARHPADNSSNGALWELLWGEIQRRHPCHNPGMAAALEARESLKRWLGRCMKNSSRVYALDLCWKIHVNIATFISFSMYSYFKDFGGYYVHSFYFLDFQAYYLFWLAQDLKTFSFHWLKLSYWMYWIGNRVAISVIWHQSNNSWISTAIICFNTSSAGVDGFQWQHHFVPSSPKKNPSCYILFFFFFLMKIHFLSASNCKP